MATMTGLDVLRRNGFHRLLGKKIGIVCNQATVTKDFQHIIDLLLPLHTANRLSIEVVFGPQHGLFGHTQDNMIEWEGALDLRTGLKVVSLYGDSRQPSDGQINSLDLLLIDLPDVGSRYYTFLWTMTLCMSAAERLRVPMMVLDRPNPIGGLSVEGPVLTSDWSSFVGLHPLPIRHGMTLGEVANYLVQRFYPACSLEVELVEGWSRSDYLEDTDVPWVMPSPNMPNQDTALVYPGGCLLEGTNVSEGRGTTRPFEILGAPFIDGWKLCEKLNNLQLPGALFRPVQFQPTFQKHTGSLCEGCFVHVVDQRAFEPVFSYVAALSEIRRQCGQSLKWNPPPYEYELEKLPIDILAGNGWIREEVDNLSNVFDIRERMMGEVSDFNPTRLEALLYP